MRLFRYLGILTCVLALLGSATGTIAQDFPARPIRLVVAFPAGGPTDFVARLLADKLKGILGQSVLIENKAGANAAIGADYVAKSEPDGYTLFFTTISAVALNPHMRADLPYNPVRDFRPVTRIVLTTEVLVVNAKSPHQDRERSRRSRKGKERRPSDGLDGRRQPAASRPRTVPAIRRHQGRPRALSWRGARGDRHAGWAGEGAFLDLPVVMPQIISGNLRAIGTASAKRDEVLPDLPTLDEQGYRDVYADNWYALYAPAKTPAAIIAKLNSAFTAALKDPEVGKKLLAAGAVPAPTTPEELGEILKATSPAGARSSRAAGSRSTRA